MKKGKCLLLLLKLSRLQTDVQCDAAAVVEGFIAAAAVVVCTSLSSVPGLGQRPLVCPEESWLFASGRPGPTQPRPRVYGINFFVSKLCAFCSKISLPWGVCFATIVWPPIIQMDTTRIKVTELLASTSYIDPFYEPQAPKKYIYGRAYQKATLSRHYPKVHLPWKSCKISRVYSTPPRK